MFDGLFAVIRGDRATTSGYTHTVLPSYYILYKINQNGKWHKLRFENGEQLQKWRVKVHRENRRESNRYESVSKSEWNGFKNRFKSQCFQSGETGISSVRLRNQRECNLKWSPSNEQEGQRANGKIAK